MQCGLGISNQICPVTSIEENLLSSHQGCREEWVLSVNYGSAKLGNRPYNQCPCVILDLAAASCFVSSAYIHLFICSGCKFSKGFPDIQAPKFNSYLCIQ